MKMKMDMNKKKRARNYDGDEVQAESTHRRRKNIEKKRKPRDHLFIENNNDDNNNSSSSAGEGCSVNIEHEHKEEEIIEIDDEKSVFDFPWSKESDGGIVNIFEDEDYLLALGLETTTFSSCSCKYNDVIDTNLGCEGASSLSDIPIGASSFPQQEKSDIVCELEGEPLILSTLKVDELEGSDWINSLELTTNATIN